MLLPCRILLKMNSSRRSQPASTTDSAIAREIARKPFDTYFRALTEAAGAWMTGTASKDYRDYDKAVARMKGFTVESQIESGGAWIGTPDEIAATIAGLQREFGGFEHASLQVNFNTMPFEDALASMRLFAREVMPRFMAPASL